MADANHNEAGRTLRAVGWFTVHHADTQFNAEIRNKGEADLLLFKNMPAVECKYGTGKHKQTFAFSQWNEDQRRWAEVWEEWGNRYWLFITVGTRVVQSPTKATPYPKVSVLIPRSEVLKLESEATRKSIAYSAMEASEYRLTWAKNNMWYIPKSHLFNVLHEKELLHDTHIA